jgi:hypothetical protein
MDRVGLISLSVLKTVPSLIFKYGIWNILPFKINSFRRHLEKRSLLMRAERDLNPCGKGVLLFYC